MDANLRSVLDSFQKQFPHFDVNKARRLIEEMRIATEAIDFHMDRIVKAVENGSSETIEREFRHFKSASDNLSTKLGEVRTFEKALLTAGGIVQELCEQKDDD